MGFDAVHRATVTNAEDPEGHGRVQVEPSAELGIKPAWAPVATSGCCDAPRAPASGEEVLIAFEAGDGARPVVIGYLHDRGAPPPEKVVLEDGQGATVTLQTGAIVIEGAGTVRISGSQIEVAAGKVTVSAGTTTFAGVVQCDTLIANSVVASSYTPGAGNVW